MTERDSDAGRWEAIAAQHERTHVFVTKFDKGGDIPNPSPKQVTHTGDPMPIEHKQPSQRQGYEYIDDEGYRLIIEPTGSRRIATYIGCPGGGASFPNEDAPRIALEILKSAGFIRDIEAAAAFLELHGGFPYTQKGAE